MPKFLVRARYSNEAFRGFLEDPADRKKTTERLLTGAGITLLEWFFVPDTGESVTMLKVTMNRFGWPEWLQWLLVLLPVVKQ